MKILLVGAWAWPHYEDAFARGLRAANIEVLKLATSINNNGYWGRIQEILPFPGPALLALNAEICLAVTKQPPDFVLFWRPTHVLPRTLRLLASMGIKTVSYNNDDPFAPRTHGDVPWHHHFLWHWYLKCLPHFTYNFFYRKKNCIEALTFGVRHAEVLLPYFMPWRDRPMSLTEDEMPRYEAEVTFVGHYESDGREDDIRALVTSGINVKLWGGLHWNRAVLGDMYDRLSPIVKAEGAEYAKALCGAKICLCFLSELNRDTYTRRCFEIPACGKVLLAERTDDLMRLFEEDQEACFFSSQEELVRKTQWLLENPDIRERIAQAGLRRVWNDGHDVMSRAKYFLSVIKDDKN